jgi:hypothetical protein
MRDLKSRDISTRRGVWALAHTRRSLQLDLNRILLQIPRLQTMHHLLLVLIIRISIQTKPIARLFVLHPVVTPLV